QAWRWYREMLNHYAVSTLVNLVSENVTADLASLRKEFRFKKRGAWINVGGQLIHETDLNQLKEGIRNRTILSWQHVHERYLELGASYPVDKANHAWLTLLELNEIARDQIAAQWPALIERSVKTMDQLAAGSLSSREK